MKEVADEERSADEVFHLGDETQTYHDRDGCSPSENSFSYLVTTVTGGNTDHTVVRALVTIDDDDHEGKRQLTLRSILPLKAVRDRKN